MRASDIAWTVACVSIVAVAVIILITELVLP